MTGLHGSVAVGIAVTLGLYAMRTVLTSPACIDCGNRLVHADDCRRRR